MIVQNEIAATRIDEERFVKDIAAQIELKKLEELYDKAQKESNLLVKFS